MRRLVTALCGGTLFGLLVPSAALAMHNPTHRSAAGGFPWDTVLLWGGIGVGIALLLAWFAIEGRRRHWHLPRRPIHA